VYDWYATAKHTRVQYPQKKKRSPPARRLERDGSSLNRLGIPKSEGF
jgi:hypothetical protein